MPGASDQRHQAPLLQGHRFARAAAFPAGERGTNPGDEEIGIYRLFQKTDCTGPYSFCREPYVAAARDHDHRHAATKVPNTSNQLKAINLRHLEVGNDTTTFDLGENLQERAGAFIGANMEVLCYKQICERFPHARIVIN